MSRILTGNKIEPTKADTPVHEKPTERIPSTVGNISGIASANAPQVFFDDAPYAGHYRGVGDITLVACRHVCQIEGHGIAADHVVTGILRGSLEALRSLKGAIEAVEILAERQRAEAEDAATGGTPPSGSVN